MRFAHHGNLGAGRGELEGKVCGQGRRVSQSEAPDAAGEAQVCLGYWRARVTPECPQLSPRSDGEVPGTITQGMDAGARNWGSPSDDRPHLMCHSCRLRVEGGGLMNKSNNVGRREGFLANSAASLECAPSL